MDAREPAAPLEGTRPSLRGIVAMAVRPSWSGRGLPGSGPGRCCVATVGQRERLNASARLNTPVYSRQESSASDFSCRPYNGAPIENQWRHHASAGAASRTYERAPPLRNGVAGPVARRQQVDATPSRSVLEAMMPGTRALDWLVVVLVVEVYQILIFVVVEILVLILVV